MKRLVILLSVGLLFLALPLSATRKDILAFYVFGDSLVANGNDFIASGQLGFNPAVPPSVSPHRTYAAAGAGVRPGAGVRGGRGGGRVGRCDRGSQTVQGKIRRGLFS